jgi:hypothetical protein
MFEDFVDVQVQDNTRDLVDLDGGMIIFESSPQTMNLSNWKIGLKNMGNIHQFFGGQSLITHLSWYQ